MQKLDETQQPVAPVTITIKVG